jgi:hypothetical protein
MAGAGIKFAGERRPDASVGQSAEKALEIHGTISGPTSAQVIESSELVHSPRERQLFQILTALMSLRVQRLSNKRL